MANKIRVYGKAQNRTALGIVHAYLVMNPEATITDLRNVFPNDLCPDKGVAENFLPLEEALAINSKHNMSLYFAKEDELLTLADGSMIAVNQIWTKASFERIVNKAEQYDIEIAKFENTKLSGEKGGFRLEYINGYIPDDQAPEEPKKKKHALRNFIILIILLLLAALAYLYFVKGFDFFNKPQPQAPQKEIVKEKIVTVTKEVVVRDTVVIEKVSEIEENFNACQFKLGKADLSEDAKFVLHDLAKLLKSNTEMRLQIAGHTSAEGDSIFNQKLSEKRAAAVVEFLVNREGIDSTRLESVGYGSSKPIDINNLEANRRTEFVILNQ